MTLSLAAVVTTIQEPTAAVRALNEKLSNAEGVLIIAGDRKGPSAWDVPKSQFLSLADQLTLGFALAQHLPVGHYARKNIGYLYAMRQGAACIYETDDDNAPLPRWRVRSLKVSGARCVDSDGWVNVYPYFTGKQKIWPRGFPLECIHSSLSDVRPATVSAEPLNSPIQQGLVNGSPDVDAIWRLTQDRFFEFDMEAPLFLGEGQWCPFNTQSTWWWPVAYPLMYVPSYCSFRMCDIWKSFIAQRCLWAMDAGVTFHPPEVVQDRNEHNLMKDFADEVPGYLKNTQIAEILQALELDIGCDAVGENLLRCYDALIAADIFPQEEGTLVKAWLSDLSSIRQDSLISSDS